MNSEKMEKLYIGIMVGVVVGIIIYVLWFPHQTARQAFPPPTPVASAAEAPAGVKVAVGALAQECKAWGQHRSNELDDLCAHAVHPEWLSMPSKWLVYLALPGFVILWKLCNWFLDVVFWACRRWVRTQ